MTTKSPYTSHTVYSFELPELGYWTLTVISEWVVLFQSDDNPIFEGKALLQDGKWEVPSRIADRLDERDQRVVGDIEDFLNQHGLPEHYKLYKDEA